MPGFLEEALILLQQQASQGISPTKINWPEGIQEHLYLVGKFYIYNINNTSMTGSIEITSNGDMDIYAKDDIRLMPNDDVHIFHGTETSAWTTFDGVEKALKLRNEAKIAFDGDSTNTYIAASAESPEDLEIHADYNLDLFPDNDVNIYVGSTNYATFDGGLQALHMKDQSKIIFDSIDSYIAANTDNPEDLEIHADQDVLLMPDQYVGVGTTTPGAKLHVTNHLGAPSDLGNWDNYQVVIEGHHSTNDTAGILLTTTADTYGGSAIVHHDSGSAVSA